MKLKTLLITLLFGLTSQWGVANEAAPLTEKEFLSGLDMIIDPDDSKTAQRLLKNSNALQEFIYDAYSDLALAKEAQALGLDQSADFKRELDLVKTRMLIKTLMLKTRAELNYPDFEGMAEERYLLNKDDYFIKPKYHVAHILLPADHNENEQPLTLNETASEAECDDLLQTTANQPMTASMLLAALRSGNVDFTQAAQCFSTDTASASQGGKLPQPVDPSKSVYVPYFEAAAFSLQEVGELTDLFETRFGRHIIKLLDITPGRQIAFTDVKEQIIQQLKKEYRASALEKKRAAAYPDLENLDLEQIQRKISSILNQSDEVQHEE